MSRRTTLTIAAGGLLILIVLHLDFWRPQRTALLFGWLPEELAYRLAYCFVAWLYILFVCSWVWREEPDP